MTMGRGLIKQKKERSRNKKKFEGEKGKIIRISYSYPVSLIDLSGVGTNTFDIPCIVLVESCLVPMIGTILSRPPLN